MSERNPESKFEASLSRRRAMDEFFSLVYEELRLIAYRLKQNDGSRTLNPTALVHEAYLKLTASGRFAAESPQHLKNTVVLAMRLLLVDAARRRSAVMHGGGFAHVPLADAMNWAGPVAGFMPEQIIAIDTALDTLEQHNQVQARVFECHFFGGLRQSEIAELLAVSEKTVQRNLRLARAWLVSSLNFPQNVPAQ